MVWLALKLHQAKAHLSMLPGMTWKAVSSNGLNQNASTACTAWRLSLLMFQKKSTCSSIKRCLLIRQFITSRWLEFYLVYIGGLIKWFSGFAFADHAVLKLLLLAIFPTHKVEAFKLNHISKEVVYFVCLFLCCWQLFDLGNEYFKYDVTKSTHIGVVERNKRFFPAIQLLIDLKNANSSLSKLSLKALVQLNFTLEYEKSCKEYFLYSDTGSRLHQK